MGVSTISGSVHTLQTVAVDAIPDDPDEITTGQPAMPSGLVVAATVALVSGRVFYSFFTAKTSFTCANIRIPTGNVAAAATPTLCRAGIYDGDTLALIGSIANDTTLFAAAATNYTRALTTPVALVAGRRYAVGIIVVSGATMPQLTGNLFNRGNTTEVTQTPRTSGSQSGQTDLPATAVVSGNTARIQSILLP